MESIEATAVMVALFFARIALPLTLTMLFGFLMNYLLDRGRVEDQRKIDNPGSTKAISQPGQGQKSILSSSAGRTMIRPAFFLGGLCPTCSPAYLPDNVNVLSNPYDICHL